MNLMDFLQISGYFYAVFGRHGNIYLVFSELMKLLIPACFGSFSHPPLPYFPTLISLCRFVPFCAIWGLKYAILCRFGDILRELQKLLYLLFLSTDLAIYDFFRGR